MSHGHKGGSTPSGDDDIQPVKLCNEDRKRLYNLLYADLPVSVRRMELALAVVVPANAALLWKVFGEPAPAQVGAALLRLLT